MALSRVRSRESTEDVHRKAGRRGMLPLSSMLTVQECANCRQPSPFFFEKHRYEREKDRHRTFCLEYFGGHDRECRDWAKARRHATLLPPTFMWERMSYDADEVAGGLSLVLRDFRDEYLRPRPSGVSCDA